jgi:hypothetical protein
MTTWRDIADQLTPSQVESLEWLEGDPLGGLLNKPEQHLMFARGWASDNLEQSLHADVPSPAHAVEVGPWVKTKTGVRCRSYKSAETGIAGLADLHPTTVRQLADALVEAVDRLEIDEQPPSTQ